VFFEIRQCFSKSDKGKLRTECKIVQPEGLHRDSLDPICYQNSVRKPPCTTRAVNLGRGCITRVKQQNMLLRQQFRHSYNKKHAMGHRSKPFVLSSHHPYCINTFYCVRKWANEMDTSTDNRCAHSLLTRWPRVQIRYTAHGFSLRKILTFLTRKKLFNTLKLDNKALTWQYPADLVFWRSLTLRHTLLPNNTLSYSATLVRWFILDHPIRASWPAHCRLLTNGFDQLTSSLPPNLLLSHRLPRQSISSLYS